MMMTNPVSAKSVDRPLPACWLIRPPVREQDREEWARAASFAERVRAHRERGSLPGLFAGALARGARPEQRWLAEAPFASPALFARRLAVDGVSEQEFRAILGGAHVPGGRHGDETPDWLARWLAAYAHDPADLPKVVAERTPLAAELVDLLAPVIAQARARLDSGVRALLAGYDQAPIDAESFTALWTAGLPARLAPIAAQTLRRELPGASLRGSTKGFFQREAALAFFRQYPLLARQLSECIDTWVVAGMEFLGHLCEDWAAIGRRFNAGLQPGKLKEIVADVGDRQRGGRGVVIAHFSCGLRLVYQPRSLALDGHFQGLLAWLNQREPGFGFRTLAVLDRGDHGWREYVTASPGTPTAMEARRRFHRRQGGYLALAYALGATDFRGSDLLTSDEQPLLLDASALFCPRVGDFVGEVTAVESLAHIDDIDDGFATMYRLLLRHRDELLAAEGPLACCANDEMRVMLRPTEAYRQLLADAYQPDYQRDALDRDRLFDRLWATMAPHARFDPLVAAEQADLRRGDLPVFLGRPGSVDLWDTTGVPFVTEVFSESALARAQRRLSSLRDSDLALQRWHLGDTLAMLFVGERFQPA